MLQRYELGRWFHETFGFRLSHLPYLAIPLFAGSIAVLLLAWWLHRRRLISAKAQRTLEVAWLVVLTLTAAFGWLVWAVDYCHRIAADRVTPFFYGCFLLIAVAVLTRSGLRRWRVNECLTGKHLLTSMLAVAMHAALFYACVFSVVIVGLFFIIPKDAPLAVLFLPNWIGQILLAVAIVVYLLLASLAAPRFFRRLRIILHQNLK